MAVRFPRLATGGSPRSASPRRCIDLRRWNAMTTCVLTGSRRRFATQIRPAGCGDSSTARGLRRNDASEPKWRRDQEGVVLKQHAFAVLPDKLREKEHEHINNQERSYQQSGRPTPHEMG